MEMINFMTNKQKLDCSGLVCPMPVAKTKRQLLEMNIGDILEVTGDYAESGQNIKRYVEKHNDKLLDFKVNGENYYIKIEKQ
jgi:tRNA 2-thiouridine synthesizing protein A